MSFFINDLFKKSIKKISNTTSKMKKWLCVNIPNKCVARRIHTKNKEKQKVRHLQQYFLQFQSRKMKTEQRYLKRIRSGYQLLCIKYSKEEIRLLREWQEWKVTSLSKVSKKENQDGRQQCNDTCHTFQILYIQS